MAERFVDNFRGPAGISKAGLIFIGPPGAGKTHLAVSIVREIIEQHRVAARFVELNALVSKIQATFAPTAPETTQSVVDPVLEAPLVALDELGNQQPTPWIRDLLYLIINTRYTRRLPTVFTTNYYLDFSHVPMAKKDTLDRGKDPESSVREEMLLSYRLPAVLVSRLFEMAQPVVLSSVGDYRRKKGVGQGIK